jgi:tetratricopeptide (TPR) repeat protein
MQQADLMDVVVPSVGISVQKLFTWIGSYFKNKRHRNISGEFTIENGLLFLTLRLDGRPFYTSPQGADRDRPANLLADAAAEALHTTVPYFFAVLRSDSDPSLSLRITNSIITASPGSLEAKFAHNLRGNILLEFGKREEAKTEFEEALAIDPNFAFPHNGLGTVFHLRGDPDKAKEEFETSIKLDPKFAFPHTGLAEILFRDMKKPDQAIDEYNKAIKLGPGFAKPYNGLGDVLRELGKREEAKTQYEKAIARDPQYAAPHVGLCDVLRDSGDREKAVAECKAAVTLDPSLAAHIPPMN